MYSARKGIQKNKIKSEHNIKCEHVIPCSDNLTVILDGIQTENKILKSSKL